LRLEGSWKEVLVAEADAEDVLEDNMEVVVEDMVVMDPRCCSGS